MNRKILLLTLVGLVVLMSGTVAAQDSGMNNIEIINPVDQDNDGQYSGFDVRITADTRCFGCYDDGSILSDRNMEPWFEVEINDQYPPSEDFKARSVIVDNRDSITNTLTVTENFAEKFTGGTADITVVLWESDSGSETGEDPDPGTLENEKVDESGSVGVELESGLRDSPPNPSFQYGIQKPTTGESIPFDASDSSAPGRSIQSYRWNFGDGSEATGVNPSHSYGSPGTYTVELTVIANDGATETISRTVSVASERNTDINLDQSSAFQGEEINYEISNTTDGENFVVALGTDNARNVNDPDSRIFPFVGGVESRGIISDYAFAEIQSDGTTALGRLDTGYLDDVQTTLELYPNRSSVGSEQAKIDDVTVDVVQSEIHVGSPRGTYEPGHEIDLRGTTSEGVSEVAVFVRDDGDYFHVTNISVDTDDNTYEATGFQLDTDAETLDARQILSGSDDIRYGVIDIPDVTKLKHEPDAEADSPFPFLGSNDPDPSDPTQELKDRAGLGPSDFDSGASTRQTLTVDDSTPGEREPNLPNSPGKGNVYLGPAGERPTVFQGEQNIQFVNPENDAIVNELTSADDSNTVLTVPIGSDQKEGTYTVDGQPNSLGVVVQNPEITELDVINPVGEDVYSFAQGDSVLIGAEYNFEQSEPLSVEVYDPEGVEITDTVLRSVDDSSDLTVAQETVLDNQGYDKFAVARFDTAGQFEIVATPTEGDIEEVEEASSTKMVSVNRTGLVSVTHPDTVSPDGELEVTVETGAYSTSAVEVDTEGFDVSLSVADDDGDTLGNGTDDRVEFIDIDASESTYVVNVDITNASKGDAGTITAYAGGESNETDYDEKKTSMFNISVSGGSPIDGVSDELWTSVTDDESLSLGDLGSAIRGYQNNGQVNGVDITLGDIGSLIQHYQG